MIPNKPKWLKELILLELAEQTFVKISSYYAKSTRRLVFSWKDWKK